MALPEIVSGAILAIGRIFGEAAALIFTAGQSSINISYSDWNPFSPTSFLNPMRPAGNFGRSYLEVKYGRTGTWRD